MRSTSHSYLVGAFLLTTLAAPALAQTAPVVSPGPKLIAAPGSPKALAAAGVGAAAQPAPAPGPVAPAQDCGLYEAIEPDDTIASIAARCGIEESLLLLANPDIGSDLDLRIGESLMIGPTGTAAAEKAQAEPAPPAQPTDAPAEVAVEIPAENTAQPPPPASVPASAPTPTANARRTTVTSTPTLDGNTEQALAPGQGDVIISSTDKGFAAPDPAPESPEAPRTAAAPEAPMTEPAPEAPEAPVAPVAPESYSRDVIGLWQEVGGSCGNIETSWAFTPTEMRNNGLVCAIDGIEAEGAALRVKVRCGAESDARSYLVAPFAGAGMTVTGNQFQTNLERCPG